MKSVWFILFGIFWLGMNVLLWRSEYGGGSQGNPLPVKTVVSKILDTPDPSELDIFYQDKPVGHCRWVVTQVGRGEFAEEPDSESDPEEGVDLEAAEMAGLIGNVQAYIVNVDGFVQGEDSPQRVRFMFNIRLNRRWEWTKFDGKVGVRNQWLQVHTNKEDELLQLQIEQDETKWETQFSFEQLKNPQVLMAQWTQGNPLLAAALAPMMGMVNSMTQSSQVTSLQEAGFDQDWSAFSDWMTISHSRMRIYRLESGEGRKNTFSITVNRAGEIISVTAPQRISLKNENVLNL